MIRLEVALIFHIYIYIYNNSVIHWVKALDPVTHWIKMLTQRHDPVSHWVKMLTQRLDSVSHWVKMLIQRLGSVTHWVKMLTQRLDSVTHWIQNSTQILDPVTHWIQIAPSAWIHWTSDSMDPDRTQRLDSLSPDAGFVYYYYVNLITELIAK